MKKLIPLLIAVMSLTACTISLQNIDVIGKASDLVDEQLRTDPDVDPTITVPVSAVPSIPIVPIK